MHKTKEVTDSIIEQYLSSSIVCAAIEEKKSECYEISYSANTIRIRAGSSLAAVWAAKQASMAVKSGYIREVLGKTDPLYPLRPLWIQAGDVNSSLKRWIPLGFNALVVDDGDYNIPEGVKVIRRPAVDREKNCSPFDDRHIQYLKETLPPLECDAVLWESRCAHPSFFNHEAGEHLTRSEILEMEMKQLETILDGTTLIYYLPKLEHFNEARQNRWLKSLCLTAGKNTVIAFSQASFWKVIRQSLDPITASLMPMIGADSSGADLQRLFSLMQGHNFSGVLTSVKVPPKDEVALWTIGQFQLRRSSPDLLADF